MTQPNLFENAVARVVRIGKDSGVGPEVIDAM